MRDRTQATGARRSQEQAAGGSPSAHPQLIAAAAALAHEPREGPAPSVSIGAAGQVNVGGVQQVNGSAPGDLGKH